MKILTFFLGGLLFFLCSDAFCQLPGNYQSLSAQEKQSILWDAIVRSHAEEALPSFTGNRVKDVLNQLTGLFQLAATFDHSSDEMPPKRIKIVHAMGAVGKINLIPCANHPFTGIYQQGGLGLARFSLATPPTENSYIPGLAIKILIDGYPSLNLQVMNALEGQGRNWNFFAKDFSNQIPHAKGVALKAMEKVFAWTRNPANNLPLTHLAAWTSKGPLKATAIAPERLYLKSAPEIKNKISEQSRVDFRLSLSKIPKGAIYELYGEYHQQEYHIGTLVLESPLLASEYGDKKLFFQHQR